MIPDIRDDLNSFYDDGTISSFIVMVKPVMNYFRKRECARKIILVCSENTIVLMKVFPDGEMFEL
jgi:hypothetical protein